MKKIILSLILILLASGCQKYDYNGVFSYEPTQPENSENILIKYFADGTKLSDAKTIDMTIYQYGVDLISTSQFSMEKVGKGWVKSFTPDSSTTGIIITFKDSQLIDNNNAQGYTIYFSDKNGNTLPGAMAGYYVALSQWGTWYAELKSDNISTSKKFEDIFLKFPEIKNEFLSFYLYTLSRLGTKDALDKIELEISTLKAKEVLTEDDLIIIAKYSSILKNDEVTKKYEELILKDYPDSKFAQEIEAQKMSSAKSAKDLKNIFNQFRTKFPNSELNTISSYRVLRRFIDDDEITEAINTSEELEEIAHPYAFVYSVNKLISKEDLQNALKLSQIGVKSTRMNYENPKSPQPNYLSKKDWDKERENYLGEMLKLKAIVLDKLDNSNDALQNAKEAQKILEGNDVELNELYSSLLVKLEKYKKAKEVIEDYLTSNKSNSKIIEYLETAYVKINGSKDGYSEYVSGFSDIGKAKLIEKLKAKMINEPAPDFILNDINGNSFKFSDFKGKTVVIDFWATWCGPCVRSFPAMQEANDKFKDNKNIEFLFVNTWERVDNKIENAAKFIKDNDYDLTVLMDLDNEVISKYKVTGIPTKFIVGPDQNIKFMSVGFAGTNEELVVELSSMIELASSK
jgi:thiol-disulfide isomerase/thioredoxin